VPQATAATSSATSQTGDGHKDTNNLFLQWYDICMCFQDKTKQALSKWEALTQLLQQLWIIDPQIKLLLWNDNDQGRHQPINLSLPLDFFNLEIYSLSLLSPHGQYTATTCYPYLFLQSQVPPAQLVEQMTPWLQATQ